MGMDIRPLRTEADYDWALAEIGPYFDNAPLPETEQAARFDVLAALIAHYESQYWPVDPPDARTAIEDRMRASGYTQSDLARLLGSRSRASEILAGIRRPTLQQASLLHRAWNIPAEALLGG
jgi:HTH-type transcriptional regulator/antitoxin HigA